MSAEPTRAAFRLPRLAYLPVLFIAIAVTAFMWHPVLAVLYLIPIAAIGYVARTATFVGADGIRVRALIGERSWPWSQVRGLSVSGRSVYAVLADGAVRLPCVGLPNLAAVSRASDGHLPQLPEATPKFAPQQHRRR